MGKISDILQLLNCELVIGYIHNVFQNTNWSALYPTLYTHYNHINIEVTKLSSTNVICESESLGIFGEHHGLLHISIYKVTLFFI